MEVIILGDEQMILDPETEAAYSSLPETKRQLDATTGAYIGMVNGLSAKGRDAITPEEVRSTDGLAKELDLLDREYHRLRNILADRAKAFLGDCDSLEEELALFGKAGEPRDDITRLLEEDAVLALERAWELRASLTGRLSAAKEDWLGVHRQRSASFGGAL